MHARWLLSILLVLVLCAVVKARQTGPANAVQSPAHFSAQSSQQSPSATPAAGNWSATNRPQIYTVSIHDSPGVADAGSHCILCGLATGNFTAVEPNLGVCVWPNGVPGAKTSCTNTCEPGHDCKQDFREPALLKYPGPSVHVVLVDVNRKTGQGTTIAEFDEPNALQCTLTGPCSVPNPQGGNPFRIGFDFGSIDCNNAASAPIGATSGLTLFAIPTAGMLPDPGQETVPPNQHNPWRQYFCLSQPSQKGGWVVQKIEYETATNPTSPVVFWETFVVLPGQQHSAYPDTFKEDFTADASGFMSVNANAVFYEGLSNDFVRTHFSLNMPGDKLEKAIQQPSGAALSTTNASVVNELNKLVASSTVAASNNLYRAWYLTYKNGRIVR